MSSLCEALGSTLNTGGGKKLQMFDHRGLPTSHPMKEETADSSPGHMEPPGERMKTGSGGFRVTFRAARPEAGRAAFSNGSFYGSLVLQSTLAIKKINK